MSNEQPPNWSGEPRHSTAYSTPEREEIVMKQMKMAEAIKHFVLADTALDLTMSQLTEQCMALPEVREYMTTNLGPTKNYIVTKAINDAILVVVYRGVTHNAYRR